MIDAKVKERIKKNHQKTTKPPPPLPKQNMKANNVDAKNICIF
jgi:hypothetical protein